MDVSINRTDPSQNFIERYPQRLDAIFLPRAVALIGATESLGSVRRTLTQNLKTGGFPGTLYPVNPKRSTC